jgi:hypothetical protein
MKFFADSIIKPYIKSRGYKRLCEIGASLGENTNKLLELESVSITIIDPGIDADLNEKTNHSPRVNVKKGLSLEVLPHLYEEFDCVLIDGDHNWYTVYNELKLIDQHELLKPGGTIFFHDVGFPYGRRDMYYQPETIPQEFTQPYERKGIIEGQSELSSDSGANAEHFNAAHEGGPRNGVLTAIEDFLKENEGKYKFIHIRQEFGLGVMLKRKGRVSDLRFSLWVANIGFPGLEGKLKLIKRLLLKTLPAKNSELDCQA